MVILKERDQLLGAEGLATAGYTQQEGRLGQEVGFAAQEEIVGNGVLSKINAALILDFLYLEGNEHRQRFRGKSAKGVDFPHSDERGRVQGYQPAYTD